jgi:uncharacterized protein (TIGR03437 family)
VSFDVLFAQIWLAASVAFAQPPTIGNCPVFPADNIWNTPIDRLPVAPNSSTYINTIGAGANMHADFGSGLWAGGPIGIPYITVPGTQTKYPATFLYADESDPGPYAIPLNAPIEGGSQSTGDRHTIAIDTDNCVLYELGRAFPQVASWQADAGAIFNLLSNALRPATWTSTDAAGLPIFAGLARYDEIAAGEIRHALRFTVPKTQRAYVWPARHYASSITDPTYPPMGLRVRLRASYDVSGFSATNQIILRALKKYGMILADNGSAWYVSGAPDSRWDNNDLHQLGVIAGSDFEVVDVSSLMIDPNSGQAIQSAPSVLSVSKTHSGNFAAGQNRATYVITVSNAAGAGATNGTVTVTETLPAGMTLVSMVGTGWTCPGTAANNCTRSDSLASGTSYVPITVTVNVAGNAPATVINQVSVSGGGSPNATATDPTNVTNGCVVTVSPVTPGVPGTAGTLTLTFTNGSCGWTAASTISWLTPAATSGTSGTLSVAVSANSTGTPRTGTMTAAGQTITVTQASNNAGPGPGLVSLSPFQGFGPNANLTLVYADPNGWAAIQSAEFIINPRWEATNRTGGCYVKYAPGTGLFTLIADDGNSIAGTTIPGSSTNIANSQCTLNAASSSATGNGNNLTLVVSLTFSASFSGQRHIWMQAYDYNNISSNWLVYGVWFPTQTSVTAGPWYRIYDPFSNSYLYSADSNEYNTLGARGFVQQGISGLVMSGPTTVSGISNIAWYRVYVNSTNSHFWTSDRNEFLTLVNQQQAYVGEGVAAFVMPYINAVGQVSPQVTNTIPFWRAAYQGANLHFWTSDPNEYNGTNGKQLPTGYKGEGIASYIFPASGAQGIGTSASFNGAATMPAEDDGTPAVVSAVNGASYVSNGVIAPGQAVTLYGRHLGGRVLMNGVAAQVVAAQDNEIRVVVPKELAGATEVSVEVEHRGRRSKAIQLDVAAANPAIFGSNQWGRGHAQAQNEDGTINDGQHGAARGTVVTLYTTGVSLDLPVEVHIGGQSAEVISVQVSGTRAGVTEVRVRIPEMVEPAPFQPVVLHVGNMFSQPGIGLAVQ